MRIGHMEERDRSFLGDWRLLGSDLQRIRDLDILVASMETRLEELRGNSAQDPEEVYLEEASLGVAKNELRKLWAKVFML